MKKKNAVLAMLPLVVSMGALVGCAGGNDADVTIVVYNWEDYINEGVDEFGNPIEGETAVIDDFCEYYEEVTGKSIYVDYQIFSTNEEMYNQMRLGSISPDLCCPSDYMIEKMRNEDMLYTFDYNAASDTFGDGLSNWRDNGSPYIKNLFKKNNFSAYAVPYFWGTMGYTYNPDALEANGIDEEKVFTWEAQWDTDLKGKITIKDSIRDTYFTAVMHVYKDEVAEINELHEEGTLSDDQYNDRLSEIFNRCDNETLAKVRTALVALKNNIYGLEVDDGKNEIVKGTYWANLAWSGDSVYSMDQAEELAEPVYLSYAMPEEGSNVWFDGWCMPKTNHGDEVREAAQMFANFLCRPDIAAKNMDYTGYTSAVAGEDIWELVNDWYSYDGSSYVEDDGSLSYSEEDCDLADISYFFGDTIEADGTILVPSDDRGRQFDAQYPSAEQIVKCAIMKDFGAQTDAVNQMWNDFKAAF